MCYAMAQSCLALFPFIISFIKILKIENSDVEELKSTTSRQSSPSPPKKISDSVGFYFYWDDVPNMSCKALFNLN